MNKESIICNFVTLKNTHCSGQFFKKLNEHRTKQLYYDITLRIKYAPDFEVKVHKLILSLNSKYFNRMFSPHFDKDNQSTVILEDICPESLSTLIDFMYEGILRVDRSNALALFKTADFLLMEEIRSSIMNFLQQTISLDNAISLYNLSIYLYRELNTMARDFLSRNLLNVFELNKEEFCALTLESMEDIVKKAVIKDEKKFFIMIMTWNETHNLSHDDLYNTLLIHHEGYLSYFPITIFHKSNCLAAKKRVNKYLIACAYDSKEIEYLDLNYISDSWNKLTEIPGMRYGIIGASLVSHDSRIFITGGVGNMGIMKGLSRFIIYDLKFNTWAEGPPMNLERKCHCSIIMNDYLYVIGGESSEKGNEVEKIHIHQLDNWNISTKMSPLADMYSQSSLVKHNNNLTLLSVYGNDHCGDQQFITDTQKWVASAPARISRNHPGVGADSEGAPIIVGGSVNKSSIINTVEKLCDGKWQKLPNLNIARECPGVVGVPEENKTYVIGGKGSEGTIEVLDEKTMVWKLYTNIKPKYKSQEYFAGILDL